MMPSTTIQLEKDLVKRLKGMRTHSRQTYNEIVKNMIDVYQEVRKRNQYDEFLHKVQKEKMKELWDNEEDDEWEKL